LETKNAFEEENLAVSMVLPSEPVLKDENFKVESKEESKE
jgi:hypothetical protein